MQLQAPSPTTDGAEDVQMRASIGDQAKHSIAAAAAAASCPAPAIPVSTSADDGTADDHHTADVAFTAAPKSPAAVIAALPASAAAAVKPSPVPAAKATAKSAAAAAANAAKKARTSVGGSAGSNKRKNKGSSAGGCHGVLTVAPWGSWGPTGQGGGECGQQLWLEQAQEQGQRCR
jgi:hypothetical protein